MSASGKIDAVAAEVPPSPASSASSSTNSSSSPAPAPTPAIAAAPFVKRKAPAASSAASPSASQPHAAELDQDDSQSSHHKKRRKRGTSSALAADSSSPVSVRRSQRHAGQASQVTTRIIQLTRPFIGSNRLPTLDLISELACEDASRQVSEIDLVAPVLRFLTGNTTTFTETVLLFRLLEAFFLAGSAPARLSTRMLKPIARMAVPLANLVRAQLAGDAPNIVKLRDEALCQLVVRSTSDKRSEEGLRLDDAWRTELIAALLQVSASPNQTTLSSSGKGRRSRYRSLVFAWVEQDWPTAGGLIALLAAGASSHADGNGVGGLPLLHLLVERQRDDLLAELADDPRAVAALSTISPLQRDTQGRTAGELAEMHIMHSLQDDDDPQLPRWQNVRHQLVRLYAQCDAYRRAVQRELEEPGLEGPELIPDLASMVMGFL